MAEVSRSGSKYYNQTRPEILQFLPPRRNRVLDVGCGEGSFSAGIMGTEEVWGIEPTRAGEAAVGRLHKVIHGTFDEAKPELPHAYFDVVVCNDVIEHMVDHDKFFREIKKYLTPQGVLVGSIPNVRYFVNLFDVLVGKDWEYQDSGTLDRTHLRYFSERSLRRAFQRHGFRVEAFRGINSWNPFGPSGLAKRYRIFGIAALVGSLGYFRDIRHLQFGFRVSPSVSDAHPEVETP